MAKILGDMHERGSDAFSVTVLPTSSQETRATYMTIADKEPIAA